MVSRLRKFARAMTDARFSYIEYITFCTGVVAAEHHGLWGLFFTIIGFVILAGVLLRIARWPEVQS